MIAMMGTLTIAAYAVYTATGISTGWFVLTLPLGGYGILRYLWLVLQRNEGGSPTEIAWEDRPIQATVVLWAIVSVLVLALA